MLKRVDLLTWNVINSLLTLHILLHVIMFHGCQYNKLLENLAVTLYNHAVYHIF